MENMKIGIDCHNLEGQRTGVGRYLWNLLREWSSTGTVPVDDNGDSPREIEFFLYFKNEIPHDVQELLNDVRSWTPHIRNLHGRSNALFKHWLLPRAATRDKVDILFCPDYVLPIRVDSRIKTAVTMHDIIYEARPEEYSWPSWKDKILLKWASKQSAKKADVIFTPSEFTKDEILKYYKVNPEKVVVTPLAPDPIFKKIDLDISTGTVPVDINGDSPREILATWQEIKQAHGINDKYIFFVGSIFNRRFLPQKIEAFAEFAKGYPQFQFLIIGKNHTQPFRDIGALVAEVNKKLDRDGIIWKEYVSNDELVYLYNGAFATLWLSSYEGFGLPVLESMACGTPVITTSMGSLGEVAGDAAMYVARSENPSEIASALAHLVRNDSYRRDLISKGLTRAAQFSWEKCARDTLGNILRV